MSRALAILRSGLFLLWMASGFFLHWFLGRIVRLMACSQ